MATSGPDLDSWRESARRPERRCFFALEVPGAFAFGTGSGYFLA